MSAPTENVSTNGVAPETQQPAADSQTPSAPAEPNAKVYFGKIARGTSEDQLREFVESAGEVSILSIHEKTTYRGYAFFAFATYKDIESAKKAVELNGKELNGRPVIVEYGKSEEEAAADREARIEKRKEARKARDAKKKAETAVASATEGEAQAAEGQQEGEAKEVAPKAKKSRARKPKRRQPGEGDDEAHEDEEDASKARIDAEGSDEAGEASQENKAAKPRQPRKPRVKKLQISEEDSEATIFVANLPFSVDDAALTSIFNNLSIQVKKAKVAVRTFRRGNDRRVSSKGFGFVDLEDPSQREEAVQKVDGTLVEGRNITAKVAKVMKPIEQEAAAATEESQPDALTAENIEKVDASGPSGGW
ncbi:hypothetical protein CNBB0630 [Cryptococcus deneoformans B-3501A]|uniref:RNA binding protein, putative n=1 Tax=Cryptococcus deneoformans (strain JEC21 / ATCC MYA-565) TaxID=214684 RepID=Q5KLI8_CRYD1|nr:RNA binding protein, putative [Cryptococcus neoformans var. neoformans JEC21]XP_777489.1 hypothetical protein CNBB0630 [Cryptococcus neoformans var. neoformans B-3501A]AAW41952.1 RNA binding protein, putative [Cryptococcus neoformans var. neoformans JEC21]EAL22842.1 hypothetical protein CNBB0630 [Cryptococcus neoformans var. neoformans B-3501A]